MNTDYRIDALNILLEKDCLPEKYHPLIYKNRLISGLQALHCKTKNDAAALTDADLAKETRDVLCLHCEA